MRDDAFPVARLGRLLGKSVHTLYREVRQGRYGAPFRLYGRLHVYIAGIERAESRSFTRAEINAALAKQPPQPVLEPPTIQIAASLLMLDAIEVKQQAGELFTHADVEALIRHNIGLRDHQWVRWLRQKLDREAPESLVAVPHPIPPAEYDP
jgi:hypothetical protein